MVGHRPLSPLNVACSGLGINAKEEDWLKLAGKDERVRETMRRLYHLFRQAPVLGSLIDPKRVGGTLFVAEFEKVQPLLEKALAAEQTDETSSELAVTAQGLFRATHILVGKFTLVATNVPYLVRAKQGTELRTYCESYSADGAGDLATVFLERCGRFCSGGGTSATVTPQNWSFLTSYAKYRRRLLMTKTLNHVAKIGSGATATASWDFPRALNIITESPPKGESVVTGVEADAPREEERALEIHDKGILEATALSLLKNPQQRITLSAVLSGTLLQDYADSLQGISTGDNPRFQLRYWEVSRFDGTWAFQQGPVSGTIDYGGREKVIFWENGKGSLAKSEGSAIRGLQAVGRQAVAITQMRELPATLFSGSLFDTNVAVILPKKDADLPAIWAYCSSPTFAQDIRRIDRKINVTNATLTQVAFDLHRWANIARQEFPSGLPKPDSADPTQWFFNGHPFTSQHPLQVAVARLLGYRWPRQSGSDFPDCPAIGPDGLEKHAGNDGVVCLHPVKGELPAADRLRTLLAHAFGKEWSVAKQAELLSQVSYDGETLEDWLRDGFFEQHCELFHQRPFIWHIWDGLKNGFHALVNYHKLAAPNGEGRRTFEKLIYAYLGDWIKQQRDAQKRGVEGADARVAAAETLKSELERIIAGESPYDIFVRWKPLHEQPIGWEPDLNDGVRINIRPFMTATTLNGRGKCACILRVAPKIKWDESDKPDFSGGKEFDGNRWNDLHYTLEFKRKAREMAKG